MSRRQSRVAVQHQQPCFMDPTELGDLRKSAENLTTVHLLHRLEDLSRRIIDEASQVLNEDPIPVTKIPPLTSPMMQVTTSSTSHTADVMQGRRDSVFSVKTPTGADGRSTPQSGTTNNAIAASLRRASTGFRSAPVFSPAPVMPHSLEAEESTVLQPDDSLHISSYAFPPRPPQEGDMRSPTPNMPTPVVLRFASDSPHDAADAVLEHERKESQSLVTSTSATMMPMAPPSLAGSSKLSRGRVNRDDSPSFTNDSGVWSSSQRNSFASAPPLLGSAARAGSSQPPNLSSSSKLGKLLQQLDTASSTEISRNGSRENVDHLDSTRDNSPTKAPRISTGENVALVYLDYNGTAEASSTPGRGFRQGAAVTPGRNSSRVKVIDFHFDV